MLVVGVFLGVRNLKGRGDLKGASRLAIFRDHAVNVAWLFQSHHQSTNASYSSLLLGAGLLWSTYLTSGSYLAS